jgi:acetyl-CoA carboxylase carboxyltransferase component/biotin carboxyl carrier protein
LADAEQAGTFFAAHPGGIMLKAVHGGGGRGLRAVTAAEDVASGYARCRSEAGGAVFAEALYSGARHVEVQLIGDGAEVVVLGDRDCGVQRRHQKLIEIAPAQGLTDDLRGRLHAAALRLGRDVGYRGLGTVEFLVRGEDFVFVEVNPQLQVEHPVTEETTGLDLVATQLRLHAGADLRALGLSGDPVPAKGIAIQARVNAERVDRGGEVLPSAGALRTFIPPTGAGVRVDTGVRQGMTVSPRYDSLLAKVIAHVRADDFAAAVRKADAALAELAVDGVHTNIELLRAILADPEFRTGTVHTGYLAANWDTLAKSNLDKPVDNPVDNPVDSSVDNRVDIADDAVDNTIRSPLTGTVVSVVESGAELAAGAEIAVLDAMKMEHVVTAPTALRVDGVLAAVGQTISDGAAIVTCTPLDRAGADTEADAPDLDQIRDDLAEVLARQEKALDAARPQAVARMRALGRRTARENIADLVDDGSFVEYGRLAYAAQRARRGDADLIANTPADGLVGGTATVGGARIVVLSYDYTVLAGTQGVRNHAKTDRLLGLAAREKLPVVFFTEGGGGRPGDTDHAMVSGLGVTTFRQMGALSGQVPLVGIVSGRCFAGNAALLGMCDVVIATPEATIGMGGPAMIEGGGLGVYRPEEVGPVEVQRRTGVIDIVAADEAAAVDCARRYLGYLAGPIPDSPDWSAPDPRLARQAIPENRLRSYDIRAAIDAIADRDSVLELRRDFGVGLVSALVRVAGRPFGLVANNSHHLGGAIDAEAADKLRAFLDRCEAYRLPVISLCDTPGFMVGPAAEAEATVRRFGALFIAGARLTVPVGVVIVRKAYGLGAQAMAAGSFTAPQFVVAWPTGELGAMGLEGAVRLAMRKELAAIADPAERDRAFRQVVAMAYANGKALSVAGVLEIDDVIDPADTRRWISTLYS